jgi:hypothetical protein
LREWFVAADASALEFPPLIHFSQPVLENLGASALSGVDFMLWMWHDCHIISNLIHRGG